MNKQYSQSQQAKEREKESLIEKFCIWRVLKINAEITGGTYTEFSFHSSTDFKTFSDLWCMHCCLPLLCMLAKLSLVLLENGVEGQAGPGPALDQFVLTYRWIHNLFYLIKCWSSQLIQSCNLQYMHNTSMAVIRTIRTLHILHSRPP